MSTIQIISNRASLRVAGVPTDPCHVIGGKSEKARAQENIEVEIDARVVLHELQQYGVDVNQDTLLGFVTEDAHNEQGRDAYITFARFIIRPVMPLSGVRHIVAPKWLWTETTCVAIDDGLVKFKGRCILA